MPVTLGAITGRIAQGIRTSANAVYVVDILSLRKGSLKCRSEAVAGEIVVERGLVKPFLQGREIRRYALMPSGKGVIIPYELINGKMVLVEEAEMKERFPRTYEYLLLNKAALRRASAIGCVARTGTPTCIPRTWT